MEIGRNFENVMVDVKEIIQENMKLKRDASPRSPDGDIALYNRIGEKLERTQKVLGVKPTSLQANPSALFRTKTSVRTSKSSLINDRSPKDLNLRW